MRVCILGSGLSCLTLAKALVNQKIYVDINVSLNSFQPGKSRTIGISKSNLEFFNKHIINIDKITWKLRQIHIFSDSLKKEKLLNFENNKSQLFSILKNNQLYKILERSLKKNKYFKIINLKRKKNFFENYDIVIVTDYFNPIAKKYFNKQIIKKYNSFAYTTIIEHKNISNDIATQIFTKDGPLAFLPVSNNKTSIVYSINNSNLFASEQIKDLIHNYNFKYKIKKINKIESFELKSFNLRSYYNNKFLAFGDLLHRIHPLAGQGFNMTLRDIKIILNIIKKKRELGLPIDYSVNKEFEQTIKHKNFIFSNGVDFIYEFFNFESKLKSNSLSKSIQFIGKNPTLNKFFTNIADQGF
jgi:2-octaprenyl-6-methoxyphenol hydroxylase